MNDLAKVIEITLKKVVVRYLQIMIFFTSFIQYSKSLPLLTISAIVLKYHLLNVKYHTQLRSHVGEGLGLTSSPPPPIGPKPKIFIGQKRKKERKKEEKRKTL